MAEPRGREFQQQSPPKEGEIKPPKNVKVGLLFQPHEIESKAEFFATKKKLKDFFTRTFSPGEKNIFLREDSHSDEHGLTFRADSEEGFDRYASFREAAVYAQLKGSLAGSGVEITNVPNLDEDVRKFVTLKDKAALENLHEHPAATYTWMELQVLDELNEEGYNVKKVYETGVSEKLAWSGTWNLPEYQEALQRIAEQQVTRNRQIPEQITSLVEEAEQQPDETNIAGLFGTNHQVLVDDLPERIRAVTDTSGSASLGDDPETRVQIMLMNGTSVADIPIELWREAREWNDKPVQVERGKSWFRRRLRKE